MSYVSILSESEPLPRALLDGPAGLGVGRFHRQDSIQDLLLLHDSLRCLDLEANSALKPLSFSELVQKSVISVFRWGFRSKGLRKLF